MHKLVLILLTFCLALTPCLAEENIHDFGGFTIAFPEGMTVDIADEITADQPFFMLYPEDHPACNLNGSWLPDVEDLTQVDPETRAQERLDAITQGYAQRNIPVKNPQIVGAALGEQDGKPSLMLVLSLNLYPDADAAPLMTQYIIQAIVSDEAFGTYLFTINTDDLEAAQPLMETLDTVAWKDSLS